MSQTVLITGVSGFIAKHPALACLRAGHRVRGTARSPDKGAAARESLAANVPLDQFELVTADLMSDAGWDKAMTGVDSVIHIASPNPVIQPKDENQTIRPAVEGTLRVLEAAASAGVKRVVQTSSIMAITYGHPRDKTHFTAQDWTDPDATDATPYSKSKTLSERAARNFMATSQTGMTYASVNPGYVYGPLLDGEMPGSIEMIQMLMAGKYPGSARSHLPSVDVRDVAQTHVQAMLSPIDGGRYPAVAGSLWMAEMSRAIREQLGAHGRKVPARELPDWFIRLIALFDPAPRSITPYLSREYHVDNSITREQLGLSFIPPMEAVLASARSIVDQELV